MAWNLPFNYCDLAISNEMVFVLISRRTLLKLRICKLDEVTSFSQREGEQEFEKCFPSLVKHLITINLSLKHYKILKIDCDKVAMWLDFLAI